MQTVTFVASECHCISEPVSLDGRTFAGVANDEQGEVSGDTRFHFEQSHFEQSGNRIRAHYSGGEIVDGYLVGTLDGNQ